MRQMLTRGASIWLALSTLAQAKLSYPTTIEVDVLFPRNNETYNNITGFPVVFALQGSDAAHTFGWNIDWELIRLDAKENDYYMDYFTGPQLTDFPTSNDFRYTFDDVAISAGKIYHENNYFLPAGKYMLKWEYTTGTCNEGKTITYINGGTTVATNSATSSVVFTAVDDGSGLDFEIPADECPAYSGQWTAESGTASDCPDPDSGYEADPDPCGASISQDQVTCLKDWFAGRNNSAVCQSNFEVWITPWGEAPEDAGVIHKPMAGYLLAVGLVGMAMVAL